MMNDDLTFDILLMIALFAIVVFVSNMSYEDELNQYVYYEAMVCEGYWPNYKNLDVQCDK